MLLPSPNELLLEGPYDKDRRIMFTLMNEYGENQAYKIKSTDPEIITVSPSSGFVRAFDRVEVSSRCQKIFVTDCCCYRKCLAERNRNSIWPQIVEG